ncbi:Alpha-1B adrenergic receptor [Trichoplax sp. H2]|uniref:G-protein coupled receptors family 1 profile domain-containing protein n=1 Tax=Trichoplax adhaerens TaxID=10228 RepID=B3S485_TRIAD|nr:hypothetical protein TRIADDRAFT_58992 [Trichoplax adhaerens]EDV22411.1 hypothetical protein TRIADDRAFT_58992 [Trichoplax adhaerens]RDD42138.1 Alpha-1B adrenergic receptor [Trichoplax sp. H2]|eukprot:XP_002114955.1 hypothetical protein TRIADDRAFT_58992 [Trichoplax adhaerens]
MEWNSTSAWQTVTVLDQSKLNGDTNTSNDTVLLHVGFVGIYSALGLFGFISNLTIMLLISCVKELKTPSNLLLLNLAFAGLIVSVFHIPWFILTQHVTQNVWLFGEAMCIIYNTVNLLSIHLISFTQVAICINRYQGLNNVLKFKLKLNNRRAFYVICTIWICALGMCIPYLLYLRVVTYQQDTQYCILLIPRTPIDFNIDGKYVSIIYFIYAIVYLVVAYTVPFLTMTVLYTLTIRYLKRTKFRHFTSSHFRRQQLQRYEPEYRIRSFSEINTQHRERVANIFFACVVLFVACNLPYVIYLLLFIIHVVSRRDFVSIKNYLAVIQMFAIVSNAILYGYFNTGIQKQCLPFRKYIIGQEASNKTYQSAKYGETDRSNLSKANQLNCAPKECIIREATV